MRIGGLVNGSIDGLTERVVILPSATSNTTVCSVVRVSPGAGWVPGRTWTVMTTESPTSQGRSTRTLGLSAPTRFTLLPVVVCS